MINGLDKLPIKAQELFHETYNYSKSVGLSDSDALEVSWNIIKSKLTPAGNGVIAMSEDFFTPTIYTFDLQDADIKVVMNSETEEFVIEAILADNTMNTTGEYFTEEDLADIANQINTYGSTLPDVDHEKLQLLVRKYGNNVEAIKNELKSEKGIFKKITAIVDKGKLWIQAALDKRYKNHTDKFKKLSIEAYGDKDVSGRVKNPTYLGFTFTNKPKLVNADIVSVK